MVGPLISLRGQGPWLGRSTRQIVDRGERRQRKIVNGYVSGDGHEIRQMPGFHTICDLTADNNSSGYERRVPDSRRPVYDFSVSNTAYQYGKRATDQSVFSYAEPKHWHCFEQIRDRLLVVGETGFRRNPIYGSPRTEITVVGLHITTSWNLQVTSTPGPYSLSDTGAPGGNGLAVGDVVYVEIDSGGSGSLTPNLSEIDNMFGVVSAIIADPANPGRAYITLQTTSAHAITTSPHPFTGRVFRTRCNRADVYPVSPEEPNPYRAIDDPDALTLWTVPQGLDLDAPCSMVAEPAWVANRMRDHGDAEIASALEGCLVTPGFNRGISRRLQRPIPFRLNPENTGDRLVLAAPSYGCIFQCPVVVPTAGEEIANPGSWSPNSGDGVIAWFNDLYDRPRSLGLPKAWLIDSIFTPVPATTPNWSAPYNFLSYAIVGAGLGWPAGTYRFAISYYDEHTGEEGLASEEVTIVIPTPATSTSNPYSYGIQLVYMVPGYWFPECLATSINIYMATDAVEACAFYKRVPLQDSPLSTPNVSAKYGSVPGGSPESITSLLYRTLQLVAPINSSPISSARDETRLAPQNRQMHRGAECFAQIRGIGFSVGHSGTHGRSKELRFGYASAQFNHITPNIRPLENEVQIRGVLTPAVDLATPSAGLDGPFGLASRYMPPSYEGEPLYSEDLFPAPMRRNNIDLMLNSRTHNTGGSLDRQQAYEQRLRMDEKVFDRDKGAAGSPYPQTRTFKDTYLVEPKGQVQVSEPDQIEVASAAAIQFLDPQKDDDGIAVAQFGDGAIICTRRETYSLRWVRHPRSEVPTIVDTDHGCIATNSMVSFDGGLAWIGDRGPVAMTGNGLKWIGDSIEHDFSGTTARYARDSRKLMRHCFGAYDKARQLVYWGMVTKDATHTLRYNRLTGTFSQHGDQGKSRFPCNEILVWSVNAGAFSTWELPSGLEALWMGELKDKNGDLWMCMLCADGRIYALDDAWGDTNREVFTSTIALKGTSATSAVIADAFGVDGNGGATARGTGENLLRVGMSVLIVNPDNTIAGKTTLASATVASNTVTFDDAVTWVAGATIRIGLRPDLRVITSYVGDASDNMDIEAVAARYSLHGTGGQSWARVNAIKSDLRTGSTEVGYVDQEDGFDWEPLGVAEEEPYGARRDIGQGRSVSPEVSIDVTFMGDAQIRLADLYLRVAQ